MDDDCPACYALGAEVCESCAQELRRIADELHDAATPLHEERRLGTRTGPEAPQIVCR